MQTRHRFDCRIALAAVPCGSLVALLLLAPGCGGARPYRAMAKAATSEETPRSQLDDHRLKMAIREALVTADASAAVHVTPYVYMGHAYLVGFVDGDAQRQTAVTAAQNVPGVRSLDTYLPTRPADTATASDLEITGEVKAALGLGGDRVTQIDLEVLAGHVVLLGVVADQAAIDTAVNAAQGVNGVTGVTNFLLLPEEGYEKPLRLLR